ncbi:PHP domain-containing protein [bacterium]|nr:PHP domain-containing protein [bacterium]
MDIKELFSKFKQEDYFSKINLHIHSNLSDGKYSFEELIKQAQEINLEYISITDHNTLEGHKKFQHPMLIKGVEFDCIHNGILCHILGYGIDVENEKLNSLCTNPYIHSVFRLLKSRPAKNVIKAIHDANGIAILAHPCCSTTFCLENFVKELMEFGLDGLEVNYPYKRLEGIVKFSSKKLPYIIAKKYNLLQTGGTDAHKELCLL